ncbi:MAG: MFS transporter, partial [Planctomycetes bacterium]|nr:MFS transporter [Planctomycetota bacterium]
MRALLPIATLLFAVAVLLTGNGLLGILLPVRAALDGFSTTGIAIIGSCYFAGFAAGCLFGARLVRAVGHIRCFTAMTAIIAAIALLHAFVVLAPIWWLLRGVTGFCFAVLYMVIESWLNERATAATRGFVLSVYMITTLTVLTLGQLLLPLGDAGGMELFAVVSILVSFAAVPVALSGATAPQPIENVRVRVGRLWRTSPAGAAACFAVGLANGPFWALAPQFALARGLDDAGTAVLMSAAVVGGALGQYPLGRLSDLGDRRRIILLTAACAGAAGVAIGFVPDDSGLVLYAAVGAWGAFAFPLYSLGVAHANDH